MTAVLVCLGWMVALSLHEFGHAIVAYIGGDTSVKEKGYLTFNVFKYTDPFFSLILPVIFLAMGGIGLPGAAVYIDHRRLRGPVWNSLVSVAGPLFSGLALVLTAIPFLMDWHFEAAWVKPALSFLMQVEAVAIILNLIPLPPLDGFGIIEPWLPVPVRISMRSFGMGGLFLIFALFSFTPLNGWMWGTADSMIELLGASRVDADVGYRALKDQMVIVFAMLGVLLVMHHANKKAASADATAADLSMAPPTGSSMQQSGDSSFEPPSDSQDRK